MKKSLLVLSFVFVIGCSGAGSRDYSKKASLNDDQDIKLSGQLNTEKSISNPKVSSEMKLYTKNSNRNIKSIAVEAGKVDIFIKTNNMDLTKQKIIEIGGKVRSSAGKILTSTVNQDSIETISSWEEVVYIEPSKLLKKQNDVSINFTGAQSVWHGTDLPEDSYYGKNVIVGIIDSGLDLTHEAFVDEEGNSRVLFAWDQGNAVGPGPVELLDDTYGTECNNDEINTGTCAMIDEDGHGTHVAGISAGRDDTYQGIASESSLIVVKYIETEDVTFSTSVTDAASYIFQKAEELNLPAVINISIGTSVGPHDGTSLFEEFLDSLVSEKEGRFIVTAAGNATISETVSEEWGLAGSHMGYAVSADTGIRGTDFVPFGDDPFYYTDIWQNSDCAMDIAVVFWRSGDGFLWTNWMPINDAYEWDISIGDDNIIFGFIDRLEENPPSSSNNKPHSYVAIAPGPAFNIATDYFSILFSGECSGFDAWVLNESTHLFGGYAESITIPAIGDIEYIAGDNQSTVCIPSTANNVLSVGSFNSRLTWEDSLGTPQAELDPLNLLEDLSTFSSYGPAVNISQGMKPNIAAPGAWIISALSSDADPLPENIINDNFQIMSGTSMASPHVAGAVALMLQVNPELTYTQIMDYLQASASTDGFVGEAPNAEWGYGKLNIAGAVNLVLENIPLDDVVEPEDDNEDQQPEEVVPVAEPEPAVTEPTTNTTTSLTEEASGSSGGGCSIMTSNMHIFSLFGLFLTIFPILIIRRKFCK